MPEESEDSAGAHIAGEIFGIRLRIPVYDGSFELEGSNPDVSLLGDQANLLFSLFLAVLGILLTAAVFTLYFRRFVKREIISPLGEMAEVSESIRNGQWDRKLDLRCKSREFLELQNAYNMMLDTINRKIIIPMVQKTAEIISNFKLGNEVVRIDSHGKAVFETIDDNVRNANYIYRYGDRKATFERKSRLKEMFEVVQAFAQLPDVSEQIDWLECFKFALEQYGIENSSNFLLQDNN